MKSNKSASEEKISNELENTQVVDFICPCCGIVTDYRCRLCGATRTTNQVSGNIIWMKNGRVVGAFTDSLQAWARMAEQYNIPLEEWPVQFRNVKIKPKDEFED